jgi:hypothetical protein
MWDLQSNLSKDSCAQKKEKSEFYSLTHSFLFLSRLYTILSHLSFISQHQQQLSLLHFLSLSVTTTTTIEHSPKPCQNSISHNQHKTSHATRISNSLIFKKHVSRLIIPFPFLSVTNPIHQSLTLFHCFGKQKTKATRSSPHSLLSPSIWPKTAPPWSRSLFSVENKFLHVTIYALNHQFRHQQFKVR